MTAGFCRALRMGSDPLRAFAIGVTLICATNCPSQESPPSPAAGSLGDTPWYNSDSGTVVPVHVKPVIDDSLNRDSRWLPKAKRVVQPSTPSTPAAGAGGWGGGLFGTDLTFWNLFGWFLLAALLCSAVAFLVYLFASTEIDLVNDSKSKSIHGAGAPNEQTIERMKHLPAELRRTDVNLRSEAERLMNEGQYDQAIILLFGHQLLLLDHCGYLRLNRGKTNGRYLRETRTSDAESATQLRQTVTAFERSYFGRHAVTQSDFAQLWQNNLDLERRIQSRQEAAA